MSDKPMDQAKTLTTDAIAASKANAEKMTSAMTAGAEQATHAAQDIGRTMMERGMANMQEFGKLFGDFKFPASGGIEAFMAAQKRNMDVFSAANRIALEGAQAVARRHMEIMQQTMAELTEGMRGLTTSESPQVRAARQADMLKGAYERAVAHMKEMSDLIQKANSEALGLLNKRFTEALDEVKQLAAKGGSNT